MLNLDSFISRAKKIRPQQKDIKKYYQNKKIKLKKLQKQLFQLQEKIQAQGKHAVLIIFQAMDAAGKDSTIRNVFQKCDIAGIENVSFKQPSKEESAHDFLWRCHKKTPKHGQITLFNRSYYEEVLVVKVHPEWLDAQNIAQEINDDFWNKRYQSINDFESHLQNSGTKVIKFMLDVTQKEQHNRLIRRYSLPEKQWKFSTGDIKESKLWQEYQAAFDKMLKKTSTQDCPWYVIPADDKLLMRKLVAEIIIQELQKLNPQFPAMQEFDADDLLLIDELMSGKITK